MERDIIINKLKDLFFTIIDSLSLEDKEKSEFEVIVPEFIGPRPISSKRIIEHRYRSSFDFLAVSLEDFKDYHELKEYLSNNCIF